MQISQDESKELAVALAQVNAYYGKTVDPKLLAWIGLIGVCGKVYGPRYFAWRVRASMEKKQRAQVRPDPVSGRPVSPQPAQSHATNQQQRPAESKSDIIRRITGVATDPGFISMPQDSSED